MAAQNAEDRVANQVACARLGHGSCHAQNAGHQEDHVRSQSLGHFGNAQSLAVDQDQNAQSGSNIHQLAGPLVQDEDSHDSDEDDVNQSFLCLGKGLGLLDLFCLCCVDGAALGQELPCDQAVNGQADNGQDGDLELVEHAEPVAFIGDDGAVDGVDGRKAGGTHADGQEALPCTADAQHRHEQTGGGDFAVVAQGCEEDDHDGEGCGCGDELDECDDDQIEEQDQDDALFAAQAVDLITDIGNDAGLGDGRTQRHHGSDQNDTVVGEAAERFRGGEDTERCQQCAAGHCGNAHGELLPHEHYDHEGEDRQRDNQLGCHK